MVARGPNAPRTVKVISWDTLARDLLSTSANWRVHSVFTSALNLIRPDGALLGIVAAPAGNAPATLVVVWQADGPGPGDPVRLDLDLTEAVLWSPAPLMRSVAADEVVSRLRRAVEVGTRSAPVGGLGVLLTDTLRISEESPTPRSPPPRAGEGGQDSPSPAHGGSPGGRGVGDSSLIVRAARTQLRRLAASIRSQDWRQARQAAEGLSGLGPGLTPSGDDALAGLALGYRAAAQALPDPVGAALLGAVHGRTTDLAVARVQHAVAGHPDEPTYRLLSTLVTGSGDGLEAAVGDLLAYGHSSGADTLVGLVVGLALGLETPALPPTT